MVDDFGGMSDDELRDELTTWAGRVAAGEARLVGELDERGAWAVHGVRSCAHWLSWRVGLGGTAARERVRVARDLRQLPLIAAAFARGELSWTQVRAVTRVATPADDERLLELARCCTGAQLERLCRGIARAQRPAADAADPERAAWLRRPQVRYEDDGDMVITIRLPAEQGQVVLAAMEQELKELRAEGAAPAGEDVPAGTPAAVPAPRPAPDDVSGSGVDRTEDVPAETPDAPGPLPADVPAGTPHEPTLADALVRLCSGVRVTDEAARTRLKIVLDPLTGWSRTCDGELLPPGAVPHSLQPPAEPVDLTRHDRGRTSRVVTPALRALLGQVDGERCRFPGCGHTRFLHAHHVTFWRDGGATVLANLVLLCSHHQQQVVHRAGHRLVLHPDRRLTVTCARGSLVPWREMPLWRPADELDPHGAITTTTLPPQWDGSGLDLGHAVWSYLHRAAA